MMLDGIDYPYGELEQEHRERDYETALFEVNDKEYYADICKR